jgi:hypothetical protein
MQPYLQWGYNTFLQTSWRSKQIERYFAPGKYAELLRSKVSEMPAGSVSFFNKGMKFIELVPHYHSASIFAFPSVWEEPFGMPVVEAMAFGRPCGHARWRLPGNHRRRAERYARGTLRRAGSSQRNPPASLQPGSA